ncbi:MAG TPA: LON peptidase substrate-binding domain-containing protein [Chloroflexota bacterium]|nr:LON peptidase substrate-binding domain-containing protein [Chloroflexota bacterium]
MMAAVELPLFPLNVVLLPDMILPIHVFEPRYREMMAHCLDADRRFGVCLIKEGFEVGGLATVFEVGTVAEITAATLLDDGRLNIMTEGRERFRLMERSLDRPFPHGVVEMLDEPIGEPEQVEIQANLARDIARRYVTLLLNQDDPATITVELPDDPLQVSYRVANLLQQVHPARSSEMQGLLEAPNAEERLRLEIGILGREYAILERMNQITAPKRKPYGNLN